MRKKFALLAVVAAALAVPSVPPPRQLPQGSLVGVGSIGGATPFDFNATVLDGGTDATYIGKENDRSGNCDGDSGSVLINGAAMFNIVCAHFVASSRCCNVGSPKMRFAWGSPGAFDVVRITDNGLNLPAPTDTFAVGFVNTLAEAIAWVNTGAVGSFHASGWEFSASAGANSDYVVHA